MGEIPADFPPVVYVPCVESVVEPGQARVALRRTHDDRVALLAYSALDRLHHGFGAEAPWVLVTVEGLGQLTRSSRTTCC